MIDSRSINVTRRLAIKETNRSHPIQIVKPANFTWAPGDEIEPHEVLQDPTFSLYCFDRENDTAIFVECADQAAVDRAPFYYQAQVEHAIGLVSMPLEVFHRVAEEIPEPPKGLIFIHSVGRCGSTLLSKVLEAIPLVQSLSEPDDLTQMVNLRELDGSLDEWLRKLIASSTKWRCKPRLGPPADWVAIKTRSEVLSLADLLGPSFRHSKHFFLYRDAVSWMRSIFRGWPANQDVYDAELNRKIEDAWAETLPILQAYRREDAPMNPVQIRLLAWVTCMEAYLELLDMELPLCAARYEDLVKQPVPILEAFFAFCGIDAVDWNTIHEVLGRDSQAGTIYDREERRKQSRELTDELVQDVHDMIATRPLLRTPDVVLPGTLLR